MKTAKIYACLLAIVSICSISTAQTINEVTQPLTKEAQKGYIDDVKIDADGKVHVIYQMQIGKNDDDVSYEDYIFDKSLKLVENKPISVPKEVRPDKETQRLAALNGGGKCTSFDALSMKLNIIMKKVRYSDWNYKKQRYESSKVLSRETVKLKNESGRPYRGVEEYWNEDDNKLAALAYIETKDKDNPKQYYIINIDFDGNVDEKPLDVTGRYSMVYSQEISETEPGKAVGKQDIIVILAPKKGSPDISEYLYLHYDIRGMLKNKVAFKSPSTNLLIHSATVIEGSVFLFGQSLDTKKAYEEVFEEYAPLSNPCYSGEGENIQMASYNKAANEEMDNFHVLKISGGKLELATTSPLKDLKSKMKTPPGEKGVTPYKGKKFSVTKFEITPNNEFLIAGQLVSRVSMGQNAPWATAYGDIVCLHLDAQGNLKAQYAVDKVYEAKKSVTWPMPMNFYFTPDGKSVFWEIYEVKGFKDTSYWARVNSYYGVNSYFPRYFPRITKIDLANQTLAPFKNLGDGKYFIYPNQAGYFTPGMGDKVYIGKNNDESTLWLGRAVFE